MEKGARPVKAKAEARSAVAGKSQPFDGSTGLQLEQRLAEASAQHAAISQILQVISASPGDVQPVFETIAANALRLCDARRSAIFRFDGELIHIAALRNQNPQGAEALHNAFPAPPSRSSPSRRAILTGGIVHIADILADPEYEHGDVAKAVEYRSVLSVPMLRDGEAIGTITAYRDVAKPFPDSQIELLKTFADQAVIAIENARLFSELEARNHDLTETLEQQTATSDILRVISQSPTDVQPVFDTIVKSAVRLCEARFGAVFRLDGGLVHLAAHHNFGDQRAYPMAPNRGHVSGRTILTGAAIQVPDVLADEEYLGTGVKAAGFRSLLGVPLLRDGGAIGAIVIYRTAPGHFADKHIELLQTFADQAVIAIENVRLYREIEVKSRELEAASRHKSEFLANMSHELRTPLNAIIGFSEVLSERMFGEINEKQAEYIGDILQSGQHLLSLINEILDLSKIEAGRMELELSDFDLPGCIENTLTLVRERAVRRGIELGLTVDERLGTVRADERKVKQVLLNLLSNALKFTPEGGRIEVRADVHDGTVEISVTDTGVGIGPEDQEAVFEEFRQVGTASKKVEGTGLGLAISRKFIELHGGNIWVESTVGSGSTFAFTLPMG